MNGHLQLGRDGVIELVAGAERAFDRLLQYTAREMNAALHLLRTPGEVAARCCTGEQVLILSGEAERLSGMSGHALRSPALERVVLAAGPGLIGQRLAEWLGGSA